MNVADKIKSLIKILVILNLLVVALGMFLLGSSWDEIYKVLKYNAGLNLLSIGIFFSINYFLWKVPFINKLFGSIPNLNGEWKGTIINKKDEIEQESKLTITQTWLNIKVKTEVARGNSSTLSSEIINTNDTWELYFVWKATFEGSSFDGTTIVRIENENELDGLYYTNANFNKNGCTVGTFKAKKINTTLL